MSKAQATEGNAPMGAGELGDLTLGWNMGGPDYLTLRISFVAKMIERHTVGVLRRDFGISLAEWRVLAQLARNGPMTVRALAERSWVDRSEVSRAAGRLIRRGCLRRDEDPADRRSPLFSCTDEGRRLAAAIQPTRDRFQQRLTDELGADADAFLDALYRLARCLVDEEREVRQERVRPSDGDARR